MRVYGITELSEMTSLLNRTKGDKITLSHMVSGVRHISGYTSKNNIKEEFLDVCIGESLKGIERQKIKERLSLIISKF